MLFNKETNGAGELKLILGFIYASNSFDNLKTDIELAEYDLIRLIGQEVYSRALAHYLSDDYDVEDEEDPDNILNNDLVHKIQSPVAFMAYKSYSQNSDLTHSDKGRQIFVSENEKPAFEWQVERDDQGLIRKYNKMLDILIEFLDVNEITEWTGSEAYTEAKKLFINSAASFDAVFPIDGSRALFVRMVPFISETEKRHILPTLGEDKFTELKGKILDNDLAEEDILLISYLTIPLVMFTMALAIRRLSIEVLPDGIYQNLVSAGQSVKAKDPASQTVRTEVAKSLELVALDGMVYLQQYMAKLAAVGAGTTYIPVEVTERMSADNKFFRI